LENSKKIAREMTEQAEKTLYDAFGEKSASMIEYTQYLLNRKK